MGYYLQTEGNQEKHRQLLEMHNGRKLNPYKESWQELRDNGEAAICVIQNPHWDGALFAYSKKEMAEAMRDVAEMGRPQKWLAMDWDIACRESGYTK